MEAPASVARVRRGLEPHASCHLAGEVGILGVVLKVAAAERAALHIHRRPEDNSHARCESLACQALGHFAAQLHVPAARDAGASGKACGGHRLAEAEMVAGSIVLAAKAVRAVGDAHARQAEALDALQVPEGGAGAAGRLLLEGHLLDERLGLLRERRGRNSIAP